jgi:hypothetical protein
MLSTSQELPVAIRLSYHENKAAHAFDDRQLRLPANAVAVGLELAYDDGHSNAYLLEARFAVRLLAELFDVYPQWRSLVRGAQAI